jgi:hypothetical protein
MAATITSLPTAQEARNMVKDGYALDLCHKIEDKVRKAIEDKEMQANFRGDLSSDFCFREKPVLTVAIERYFKPKGYEVEIEYYGGGTVSPYGLHVRVSWFHVS